MSENQKQVILETKTCLDSKGLTSIVNDGKCNITIVQTDEVITFTLNK